MIGPWLGFYSDFWGQAEVGNRRFVDVIGLRYPPLEGCMSQPRGCRLRAPNEMLRRTTPWGTQWGQLDGRS